MSESTGFDSTLYRARIITCYKNTTGKELSTIELVQDGTTEWTLNGYPLFQTGDRLLPALAPCSDYEGPISDYLGGYYLVNGGAQTAMQIIESEDGDVCRTFMPSMTDLPSKTLTALMKDRAEEHVTSKHRLADPSVLESIPPYTSAAYADLKEMIQKVLA